MKIFVHLRHGFNAKTWEDRYRKKLVPDLSPYGYHHAKKFGCEITYSTDHEETFIKSIFRRSLAKILGFDLIHVKRNLRNMENADVIWTHTEYEFLAILFFLRKLKKKEKPKIISQIIWLADRWNNFSFLKKFMYRSLLKKTDILTFHSLDNLKFIEKILPEVKKELVLFGISLDSFPIQRPEISEIRKSINVLSVGNDIHRDWSTLLDALGNKENIKLRILNRTLSKKLEEKYSNLKIIKPKNLDEIKENYKWADLVVVPLKENLHASGITVILEATTFGKPVVCSKTGGLEVYFSEDDVYYIPVRNKNLLYKAVIELKENLDLREKLVKNAQKTLIKKDLTTEGFAKRHYKISQNLLRKK